MFRTALIVSSVLFAVPAAAATSSAPEAPTIVVTHTDLDLSSTAGQQRLDRRVRTAARRLCQIGSRDLDAMLEMKRCLQLAIARAEIEVDIAIAAAGGHREPARFAAKPEDERS